MAARTLSQILSELNTTYKPQIESIRQRQALIPQQIASEEAGLGAKQEAAFGDILGGARRRGLGFSGIPLEEQARYTSTEYLPALARLRQSGREQALSLEDAILGINERRQSQAQSMFENERNFYEQQRQFNQQLEEQRRQAAASRAAASAASAANNSWLSALTGGGSTQSTPTGNPLKSQATAAINEMLTRRNTRSFIDELVAINKSAGYGNQLDQAKLELLQALQPGFFQKGKLNTKRIELLKGVYK